MGRTKMKTAKKNCRAIPHKTTCQLMTFLFEEQSQANPAKTRIPKKLTKLLMPILFISDPYSYSKQ
jgi:hypothetical protein